MKEENDVYFLGSERKTPHRKKTIYILEIPEGEEKEKLTERILKAIMAGVPGWLSRLSIQHRFGS